MNESAFLERLISTKQIVTVRLLEARDIVAVLVGQDANTLLVRNENSDVCSLIYKKAVSVITPMGD